MTDLGIFGPGLGIGSDVLDYAIDRYASGDGPDPVVRADPAKEYVATPPGFLGADDYAARYESEWGVRAASGWHGRAEYERIHLMPAVGSSFNALRSAVLAGPTSLLPAIRGIGSSDHADQQDGTAVEAEMAAQVCASNLRLLDRWEVPVDLVLWEMMEAMYLGHTMAEKVVDDVVGGPDDGLTAIRALKTRPHWSYRFRVDPTGNVVGIGARTVDGWEHFEPDHFAWLTWDPRHGDPRGRSAYRMAHYHARMLMDLWPEVYKGWKQFGTPFLYGTTAPNAQSVPPLDRQGNPIPGRTPIRAETGMSLAIARIRNGDAVAGPNGSDVKVVESTKDSSVVSGAVSMLEAQIIRAILLQIRATVEAKHGSKADSETGQDIMGTLIRFVRKWLERFLRSVLAYQNRLNYGEDIARRLTPIVTLGEHEHQDFAAEVGAVAALVQCGYFCPSQFPSLDNRWGFQQRQPGELRVGPNGPIPETLPPDPAATPAPADAQAPDPKGAAA